MNRILVFLLLIAASTANTFHFKYLEKQHLKLADNRDHHTIRDDINWDKIGDVCEQGVAFLEELESFVTSNELALKSLRVLKMVPVSGELIFALVTLFMDIPDPALAKLDEIQNALANMQDRMLNEFANVQRSINSVDCKGRLSEYKNVIQTAFREVLNYGNEQSETVKEIYKLSLLNALFDVKAAINYMVASVMSQSTSDLSACPILDIIEKGDESTDFLQSSDAAIFTMANVMMNEIIFGTTVVGMIYNIQYGNATASAMIGKEYNATLVKAHNATL